MSQDLKNKVTEKMDNSINALKRDLMGLRTGRASISLLEPVTVDIYGSKMPLSQVGTISTPDAKTLAVQVWDKGSVKAVEKAISDANLGLSPSADGQLIRMNLPPLSEERRKDLVKVAHKYGENTKITLRNIRRDGMEELKQMEKNNEISEDELHVKSDEVQKIIDDYNKKVDALAKSKEEDILTI